MRARLAALVLMAVLVLATGLFVGLGAGTAASSQAGVSGQGTASTATQPVVTTVTTPTVPAQQLPGYGRPVVHLGDSDNPEQFIIGQLYELALEQQGYTVMLTRNIGSPWVSQHALEQGTLDLFPDYLDQWNSYPARLHRRFRSLAASYAAGSAYARRHGFELLPPTPFSDTGCLAVSSAYARQNGVYSIEDLARGTRAIFGVPLGYEQSVHGLPALVSAYHLHPAYVQPIGIGLGYGWLQSGNAQATYCNTTDPDLAGSAYLALRDPKHVFGFGNVVPVTTKGFLQQAGPQLKRTIERVDSLLTLQAVRGLNSEYVIGHHNATLIAQEFLQGNGILPPSRFAPVPTTTSTTSGSG